MFVVGRTEEEKIRNDMTYSTHVDNRMALVRIVYNPEFVSKQCEKEISM